MDNTTLDLSGFALAALRVAASVSLMLAARYIPRAISAVDHFLDIKETDQQKAMLTDDVNTAIGVIETKLDQRAMLVAHVNISNPLILSEAQAVIAAAPQAAAAMGVTVDAVARRIVGGVDTLSRTAQGATPATPTIIAVPLAAAPVS